MLSLRTSPPRKREKKEEPMSHPSDNTTTGIIRFEVDNVSKLDSHERSSVLVKVGGVPWGAKVCKEIESHSKKPCLFVYLYGIDNDSRLWSIDVKSEYILVNSDPSKNFVKIPNPIMYTYNHRYNKWGGKMFDWSELIDEKKGFIKDDKIKVEIHFRIISMKGITAPCVFDFTDPNEPRHDVAFIINGEKVYASKQILAVHSPVFNAMFYGNFSEKDQKEIELKDVDREEFIGMLRVIYSLCQIFTDESARSLLKLGDRFQSKLVIDLAEKHFISSTTLGTGSKLLLSDQYRLIELQDAQGHCLKQIETADEVNEIKKTPAYEDLSDATKVALLEIVNPSSGIIRFEIDNVSTLDSTGRYSPEVEVGGVPWQIGIRSKKMGLFVCLSGMANKSRLWSIDVKAEHILVNSDTTKNITTGYKKSDTYCHDKEAWGETILEWSKLIDEKNGFIKDDKITVEINFRITSMRGITAPSAIDFTDPNEPRHDVAFIINGEKIYASKQILAVHSPVFNAMFYGNFSERDTKEIELNDVDREEFLELLRVIYPSAHKLTDINVRSLLKLGDCFQIKVVLDLAENHLISSTAIGITPKLLLSDQYRLIKLQDHCLNQLGTVDEVKEIKKSAEYGDISDATKVALLEKALEMK